MGEETTMKNTLLYGLASTALLGALAVAVPTVHAEDSSNHMTTDAGINFYDQNKPGPGPFYDNLALAYVPTRFDFGSHEIDPSNKNSNYSATYKQIIANDASQYVAVSDDRQSSNKTSWALKADLDDFSDTKNATTKLENAELTFKTGAPQKYNIDIEASDKAGLALPNITDDGAIEGLGDTEKGYYSVAPSNVKLVAGTGNSADVLKFTSPEQNVAETLAVASQVSNVQLKVLDHTNANNNRFTSTVHWRLTADPE